MAGPVTVGVLYNTADISLKHRKPFRKADYNTSYELLSRIGSRHGLCFVFSKYSAYGRKRLRKGWVFRSGRWERVENIPLALVYDKFEFSAAKEDARRRIAKELKLVNTLDIERLCKDKWLMYLTFPDLSVPTARVRNRRDAVAAARKNCWDPVVLKPRFGVGGAGIRLVSVTKLPGRMQRNTLMQPFMKSGNNPMLSIRQSHDFRAVVINGRIDHCYVRIAQKGFRSNVALGGRVRHVSIVPVQIRRSVAVIDRKLRRYTPRVYTADFLIDSSGKAWLGEMNSQPAMYLYFGAAGKRVQKRFFSAFCRALRKAVVR